jgi:hypothetical protein
MKITPTGVAEACKSLQANRFYPISDMYSVNSAGQGTGSAAYDNKHKGKVHTPAPLPHSASGTGGVNSDQEVFSFAEVTKAGLRPRSFSLKRKELEVSPNSVDKNSGPNKSGLDNMHSSHLSSIQENGAMFEQLANEIHDAASSDPVLVSIVSRLCTGLSSQNSAILYLLNNNNNGSQPQVKIPPQVPPKPTPSTSSAAGEYSTQTSQVNSRRTLKQHPLGGAAGPWLEVKQKRMQKGKEAVDPTGSSNLLGNNNSAVSGTEEGQQEKAQDRNSDPFATAVCEAERLVVIYNLNLGQSPLLNPITISSKVTSALIKAAADNLEGVHNGSIPIAGEMVNDLLSQVRSMNLFGKGKKPCKDPKNPAKDGTFYTVPVKLSFNNKQVAKTVNDMLRQKYKVSTSIPYHRTLKKAITLAHDKISKSNPGKQVLISLDAANKCLKPFVRDPPFNSRRSGPSNWCPTGGIIALPYEAFDPKLKELTEDFSLPTSPTLVQNGENRIQGQSFSGNTNVRLKPPSPRQLQLASALASQLAQESQKGADGNSDTLSVDDAATPPLAEVGMEASDSVDDENNPTGLRPDS